MSSVFQILYILLIGIRLLLKANHPVCIVAVPAYNQPDKPFYAIPYIKRYIEHFLHLGCVNTFMVDGHTAYHCIFFYKRGIQTDSWH